MPNIYMQQDTLNELNRNYEQAPLKHPVFLNSVPKSGTHLVRNILRMFVPVEQQFHETFIQIPNLHQMAGRAFSLEMPMLSWGHLLCSDESVYATAKTNNILLVRDPYTWVLARARFFLSENFEAKLEHLRRPEFSGDSLLNMMIYGIHGKSPPLVDIFTFNAVSWLGSHTKLYRFEDVLRHLKDLESRQAEAYFGGLLDDCGIDMPADWRERVRVGSDRKQSGTARENLTVDETRIPKELPVLQRKMVDQVIPGVREILGYH